MDDQQETRTDTTVCPTTCPLAWLGVAAMAVALFVTAIQTATAGAQLPSTSPTPGEESVGAGGSAGQIVFFVIVVLIVGTTVALFVRHRGNQRQ